MFSTFQEVGIDCKKNVTLRTEPHVVDLILIADLLSDSDSDADRPQPDVVADDLASRRFRSPSPSTPTNFAVPMSPQGTLRLWTGSPRLFRIDSPPRHTAVFSPRSDGGREREAFVFNGFISGL